MEENPSVFGKAVEGGLFSDFATIVYHIVPLTMYKRRYFIILLMAVAFQMPSLAQYEQYNPCDVVDVAMRKVDERMADGNLQGALDMLKKIQADPKVQDCDQMKVVNYKIKLVEEEIARQNKNSNANSGGSAKSYLSCPDATTPT